MAFWFRKNKLDILNDNVATAKKVRKIMFFVCFVFLVQKNIIIKLDIFNDNVATAKKKRFLFCFLVQLWFEFVIRGPRALSDDHYMMEIPDKQGCCWAYATHPTTYPLLLDTEIHSFATHSFTSSWTFLRYWQRRCYQFCGNVLPSSQRIFTPSYISVGSTGQVPDHDNQISRGERERERERERENEWMNE